MSKHRKHNRSAKRKNREGVTGLSAFFTDVLPLIEKLEQEDKILLVLPTDKDNPTQGCVISDSLATEINIDYISRMADYTRQCGSLEAYYDFRARNPKWAAKHNPDQMLLNICRAARLVIGYRYGLALGNAEYRANDSLRYDNDTLRYDNQSPTEEQSSLSSSLSLDESPLFITMMGPSEDMQATFPSGEGRGDALPQSVGYELNGEITLERYVEKSDKPS